MRCRKFLAQNSHYKARDKVFLGLLIVIPTLIFLIGAAASIYGPSVVDTHGVNMSDASASVTNLQGPIVTAKYNLRVTNVIIKGADAGWLTKPTHCYVYNTSASTNWGNGILMNGTFTDYNCSLDSPLSVKAGENITVTVGCVTFGGSCLGGGDVQEAGSAVEGTNINYTSDSVTVTGSAVNHFWNFYNGGVLNITTQREIGAINLTSPVNNYETLNSYVDFNCSFTSETSSILNLSLIIDGIVNHTVYNTTADQRNLYLNKTITGIYGTHNWSCNATELTEGELSSDSYQFSSGLNLTENSLTYNSVTTEGNTEDFILNISLNPSRTLSSAYFIYNNTQYSTSIFQNGYNYSLSKSLSIPSVNATVNNTFYWILNLDNGAVNSTLTNQTVINFGIDNCTANSLKILNYTLYDEKDLNQLNATALNSSSVGIDLYIYPIGSTDYIVNFSSIYNNKTSGAVCISTGALNNTNYTMNVQIKYEANSYSPEYYNLVGYSLNNESVGNNISLYDLADSQNTDFSIIFKGQNYEPVSNARVIIYRKYVGEGVNRVVEAPLTDRDGRAVVHLDKDNGVIYNVVIEKAGEILATLNEVIPVCQDTLIEQCEINLNAQSSIGTVSDFARRENLVYDLDFNQTSRTITTTFYTIDLSSVNITTIAQNFYENETYCSNSLTASSGNFDCVIPGTENNLTIVTSMYKDGELITSEFYVMSDSPIDIWRYDGFIYAFLIILVLVLVFSSSTVGMLVALILGMIVSVAFSMISVGGNALAQASPIIFIVVCVGILLWKLTHTKDGGGS